MGSISMDTEDLPPVSKTTVLIIGGGPSGLTAALLLAQHGLRSIVVERHHGRTGQPKAHAINPRSLEIFRQMGLDTAQLRKEGMTPEDGEAVRFVVSMVGHEHGKLTYERQDEATKEITPEPLFNIPQPILEEFLQKAVEENELIEIHRGVQWEKCSQDGTAVLSSKVLERQTGALKVIESAYVLDCGGANSRAREQLRIPFEPLPEFVQNEVNHLSIHIKADLTKFKPATLVWVSNPGADGTFICYQRDASWVLVTYYDPTKTNPKTFTEEYCQNLVDTYAIGEKVNYDILSITVWSTWPRTADFYQSKIFPHAFVVGDAAHAFPPTGGLGVNTGIADAQNLVWKIAAVEKLWASESILSTYGTERRPIAVANARQSVRNQVKLRGLKAALRDAPASASTSSVDNEDYREWKKRLDHELEENAEHFDSINLQIGYTYGTEEDGPCDVYVPRGAPGARIPHAWVTSGGKKRSVLDLFEGNVFTIISNGSSESFLSQAANSSTPLKVVRVGEDFQPIKENWLDIVGLSSKDSGLLVRPDQHILGNVRSAQDVEILLRDYLRPEEIRTHISV